MEKDCRSNPISWRSIREGLTDRYGIPQVRFHTNAEYDHAFAIRDEMCAQMEEILKISGAELYPFKARESIPHGQRDA